MGCEGRHGDGIWFATCRGLKRHSGGKAKESTSGDLVEKVRTSPLHSGLTCILPLTLPAQRSSILAVLNAFNTSRAYGKKRKPCCLPAPFRFPLDSFQSPVFC